MDVCLTNPALLLERFHRTRKRTRMLFALLKPEAFDQQPIPLRHPLRFYEGHVAAFNANMLAKAGFDGSCHGADLSRIFARGIDPHSVGEAAALRIAGWPSRERVLDYSHEVDQLMASALNTGESQEELAACIEHEEMHQETLVYLMHQLPYEFKNAPADYRSPPAGSLCRGLRAEERDLGGVSNNPWVSIPAGMTELGAPRGDGFGWDNEYPLTPVFVGDFEIQAHKVSNGDYLAFVQAGGYEQGAFWSRAAWKEMRGEAWRHPQFWRKDADRWLYRGLFQEFELPLSWPAMVSYDEACAYANWKSQRILNEAEFGRAAFSSARPGERPPVSPGNYDFQSWEFQPVDAAVANEAGVADLFGNGWEWTATPFTGLPGFKPMRNYPEYSADFFDGLHFVLKGASPVTPRGLVRASFRNWFRSHYRYAYTTFRCVRDNEPVEGRAG